MIRQVKCLLAFVLVATISSQAVADDAEQFLEYYSWWDGKWEVQAKEGDQVTTNSMEITRQEPNCHLVKGGGISLWGYDPSRKKWVGSGFNDQGEFFTTVLDRHKGKQVRPGTEIRAKSRIRETDGRIVTAEETWSYIDENTARITVKYETKKGEPRPAAEWTIKRVSR